MSADYVATFLRLGPKVPGVLYEPVSPGDKRSVAIVAIHCEADYLDHTIGPGLAKRGYTVLCGKTHDTEASLAVKIQDVSYAVAFLRKRPGIQKIILMGHSGGASLMSAYQNIAENGVKTFQGSEKLIPCPDFLEGIPAADGFLCLDSNWGNGTMTLFGTDPAVVDERGGLKLDPSLDAFNPANGWTPEGATYSDEFLKRFSWPSMSATTA